MLNRAAYGGWKAVLPSHYTASSSKLFVGDNTNVRSAITTAPTHKYFTLIIAKIPRHIQERSVITLRIYRKKDPLTVDTKNVTATQNMWYSTHKLNTARILTMLP